LKLRAHYFEWGELGRRGRACGSVRRFLEEVAAGGFQQPLSQRRIHCCSSGVAGDGGSANVAAIFPAAKPK
jgi:hypothetical protein